MIDNNTAYLGVFSLINGIYFSGIDFLNFSVEEVEFYHMVSHMNSDQYNVYIEMLFLRTRQRF